MNIVEYPDSEMMAIALANLLAGELENVLVHEARASFAVPGGTTPGPIFDILCDAQLDWERVDLFLTDERWLPEVHVRSNTRLIKERLTTGRAAAARFHPLFVEANNPEDVLPELEAGLEPCLPISVLLLGMGADMHTASLFPGGDNLELALSRKAPLLVPMRAPGAPEPRVTLSARVLNEALSKHIVISGIPKRNAIEKAAELSAAEAPIAAVLDNSTIHWTP